MTNPDDIVRVRARLEGRASVYEANGWAQAYTTGLLRGNGVLPNTVPDMNVLVGGSQDNPDVVIAQNANGYKIALDIVGQQAVTITAPASQSRISAIVAYTDDLSLASTDSATTGSPSSCGLIVVNGNTASTPTEPSEATIRSAITADGATGSQACYCVIATILVSSSTTTISTSLITPKTATLAGSDVVSATNIDFTTMPGNYSLTEQATPYKWINGKTIYKKTIETGQLPDNGTKNTPHGISDLEYIVNFEAAALGAVNGNKIWRPIPYVDSAVMTVYCTPTNVGIYTTFNASIYTISTVTLYYTKGS